MRLPSLAQRGEGRAGGWEWGVTPTVRDKPQKHCDANNAIKLIAACDCQPGAGGGFNAGSGGRRPNRRLRPERLADRIVGFQVRPANQVNTIRHGGQKTRDCLPGQVAVIRGKSLILNLPGQPKAIAETLEGLKNADGSQAVAGIFAAVPYCIDLIGGPYLETDEAGCKAFRPKSAIRATSA